MKVNNILFGAAYYDEYMPYDRIEKDMEMMVKAGINTIRIAESTWSTWEPEEGRFDFTHLHRMLDCAEKYNLSVIVGTPTYAIPSWLADKADDILAMTHHGQNTYGPRQNMDVTSPIFRKYAERIIRKLMEQVKARPCVIGYQLDNETHTYDSCGERPQKLFVEYLKEKFPDINSFNHEFGLDYWSNRVDNWEHFPDIKQTINESIDAEFKKFQRKIVTDYLNWQLDIVSEYKRPDQFITHNFDFEWHTFSYGMHPEVDQCEASKRMDVAGCDIYHPSQYDLTGHEITACGNIIRGLKRDNYLILETEAQGNLRWLPFPGQLRLHAFSHIANGANAVMYWHWHSIHNAIESYWKGILSHDLAENETYREISTIGNDLKKIGDYIKNLKKINKIAVVMDNNSLTGLTEFPTANNGDSSYNAVYRRIADSLSDLNIEFDVIPADKNLLSEYSLIILPALYSAKDEFLNAINAYVETGGNIIATFKTGFADEYLKIYCDTQPHIINKSLGIHYDQFTHPTDLKISVTVSDKENGENNIVTGECSEWMELVKRDTAESIANYQHKFWGDYSAVTVNSYGKGKAMYIATLLDEKLMSAILSDFLQRIDFKEDAKLSFDNKKGLTVKQGINDAGNHVLFFLNYTPDDLTFSNIAGDANLIMNNTAADPYDNKKILKDEKITLPPWGVAVLEYPTYVRCKNERE